MRDERQLLQIWHALPFTRLFQSFRMAVGPTKMIIAVLTVIVVCFVGWLMDVCTETRPGGGPEQAILTPIILSVVDFGKAAELEVYVTEPERTIRSIEQYKEQGAGRGVFSTLWNFGAARFNGATVSLLKLDIANALANIWLCAVALAWAIKYHTVYSIVYFIIVTIVIFLQSRRYRKTGEHLAQARVSESNRYKRRGVDELVAINSFVFDSPDGAVYCWCGGCLCD